MEGNGRNGLDQALKQLNQAQRRVVEELEQSLLVMAPAGTGKTNVIALRTAKFIEAGIQPSQILCLTFTNKACYELKDRLTKVIGVKSKGIVVKTFHSLCYQLIKEEAKALGKLSADVVVIDEEDAKEVIKRLVGRGGLLMDHVFEYIQSLKVYQMGRRPLDSSLVEEFHQSEAALRLLYRLKNSDAGCETLAYLSQYGSWLYLEYQHYLRHHQFLDFNDLLLYADECLSQKEILTRWQSRFAVVVVDEVQDTSLIEYHLIKKIAHSLNFSAFGDFNQTIYEWRDSNPVVIRQKIIEDFSPLCLELSLNYRSTKRLVMLGANYLENGKQVGLIHRHLSPKCIESASDEMGTAPVFYEAATKQEEMNFIIDHLKYQRQEELANTVILTRSNRQNSEVANFLQAEGIACYLVDQLTLFKRKNIKDLLSVIKFYLNPYDELSLKRFLPLFGETIDWNQMSHPAYLKRYKEYDLRLTDFFRREAYQEGEPYGLLKKVHEEGRLVIFDVESTGLDVTRDEVVQIAAIALQNGRVIETFERFIKPHQSVGDSALVHGFTDEFLERRGEEEVTVFSDFLQFIQGALLIGHNVGYDMKIVRSHMGRIGLIFEGMIGVYDTLDIVRRLYPTLVNHKLDTVGDFIGVDHEPTHNAMDDILATKDVLLKSMPRLMQAHEKRKNVMAYYQEKLNPVIEQLHEFYALIETKTPMAVLLTLKERFKHVEEDKVENETVEQAKFEEFIAFVEAFYRATLKRDNGLFMWEVWMRLLEQLSLSSSELDRVMKDQNKLAVITVHQSKGLEFDHVIIPFLNKGMFPLDFQGTNQEEECRLFYVAMTRAKKTLLLTRHVKEHSTSKREKERSPFIDYLYTMAEGQMNNR